MKIKFLKNINLTVLSGGGFDGAYQEYRKHFYNHETLDIKRLEKITNNEYDIIIEDDGCLDGDITYIHCVHKNDFEVAN